jgi:hypothetical protein
MIFHNKGYLSTALNTLFLVMKLLLLRHGEMNNY